MVLAFSWAQLYNKVRTLCCKQALILLCISKKSNPFPLGCFPIYSIAEDQKILCCELSTHSLEDSKIWGLIT